MDSILSFIPTTLTFDQWSSNYKMEYSSISQNLPINIHLLTLEEWTGNSRDSALLRLEHIFEKHEDPNEMSKPVTLKLEHIFKAFQIDFVEEVVLGANLRTDKLDRLKWNVMNEVGPSTETENYNNDVKAENGFEITLKPFQIRSFIVNLKPNL